MSSSSSTTFSLIPIFHGLSVIKHSKTPITEPSPHYGSTTLVIFFTYKFVLKHVIPSLIGYIIIVLNFKLCHPVLLPGAQFSMVSKAYVDLPLIPFHLEQQAWFQVCVVPLVPITFRFTIPLTWCHCRSITSSRNLSTSVSWSSSTF